MYSTRLAQRSWFFEAVNRRLADPVMTALVLLSPWTSVNSRAADEMLSHGPLRHIRVSHTRFAIINAEATDRPRQWRVHNQSRNP